MLIKGLQLKSLKVSIVYCVIFYMSCPSCSTCGIKEEYYSLAIGNPLYYTQTIQGITKFYRSISTISEYIEPGGDLGRIGNWSAGVVRQIASVSNSVDEQGNYILTVLFNIEGAGQHGYVALDAPGQNYTCSDATEFKQIATIANNGTGATTATLEAKSQNCCACAYSARYNATTPFEEIQWQRSSNGCPPGFIVCSPDQSYLTLGPASNTLCLPPNCPDSSYPGSIMISEVEAKDFLVDQQKVIDIKKTFPINWSTSLSNQARTIPNPIEGGRFIRFKPSLTTGFLKRKEIKIEIKNEDCDLLETFERSINASSGPGTEVEINLAKYAIQKNNTPWGPNQIGKKIIFQVSEI